MADMTISLTRSLARRLGKPVDTATRERAALHVLDWLGCALIGSTEPVGQLLLTRASQAPAGQISVIGGDGTSVPDQAVFCNGGLGNVLEMDDIHRTAILHPGPVVIPAALAAAELAKTQAGAFLDAVVRGYESQIRIGVAVGPGHYANWHNTATCGPFGAAAAVCSVMGLDEDQIVWALGNAGTQSSGPWRCRHEQVMTKQLHTARAAEAGFVAASLAAIGFSGPQFILEGEQGFFDAMCPDPCKERILAKLDGPWKIWETSFKPWPACRHAHAAIDAALELRRRHDLQPENISEIGIRTFADARRFCDRQDPASTLEAKFSLQHSVAVALLDGEPDLQHFEKTTILRRDVGSLRSRMSVRVTERFQERYPGHYGSGVDITMSDGAVLSFDVPDALGDPENPLTEDRIVAKSRRLMAAARLPDQAIEQLIDATLSLRLTGGMARFSVLVREIASHMAQGRTA